MAESLSKNLSVCNAFLRSGSKFSGINLSASPSIANLVGKVSKKASSLKEILTLLPISLPSSNAKALESASLTLLPNRK